jgi:hypothetical protein
MADPRQPVELSYGTDDAGGRPVWVWFIVVIYLLIVAPITLLLPVFIASGDTQNYSAIAWASGTALVMTLCGLGLILTPVKKARRRPYTRSSVWIPIAASGFLMGLLVVGAGLALIEYFHDDRADEAWFYGLWIGGGAVWVAWSLIWWLLTSAGDPTSVVSTLHRWLIGGSVAELLVAVPTHLVVRRRGYCCAGIYTATGIIFGVAVMILAFGPAVAFLFFERWKKIRQE